MTVHLQTGILSGAHLTVITPDDGITVFVSLSGSHNDFLCHVTIYSCQNTQLVIYLCLSHFIFNKMLFFNQKSCNHIKMSKD